MDLKQPRDSGVGHQPVTERARISRDAPPRHAIERPPRRGIHRRDLYAVQLRVAKQRDDGVTVQQRHARSGQARPPSQAAREQVGSGGQCRQAREPVAGAREIHHRRNLAAGLQDAGGHGEE